MNELELRRLSVGERAEYWLRPHKREELFSKTAEPALPKMSLKEKVHYWTHPESDNSKLKRTFTAFLGAMLLGPSAVEVSQDVYTELEKTDERLAAIPEWWYDKSEEWGTEAADFAVNAVTKYLKEQEIFGSIGGNGGEINEEPLQVSLSQDEEVEAAQEYTESAEESVTEEKAHSYNPDTTYRLLAELLEKPKGSLVWTEDTQACLHGSVVPESWPLEVGLKVPEELKETFELDEEERELPVRIVSFRKMNDRILVCALSANMRDQKLILTDPTHINYDFGEFKECEEYLLIRDDETIEEANERILNLNPIACELSQSA